MDSIQIAYDNVINRVIELTYIDLVSAMIERRNVEKKEKDAANEPLKKFWHSEWEKAQKEVNKLSEWFIVVIPKYRDLDGSRFIGWAQEEADEYERTGIRRNHKPQPETDPDK